MLQTILTVVVTLIAVYGAPYLRAVFDINAVQRQKIESMARKLTEESRAKLPVEEE